MGQLLPQTQEHCMEFFNAAADWADRNNLVVTFERDEVDGWYAKACFSDTGGPYSATVDLFIRRPKRKGVPAETVEDFGGRVAKTLNAACAQAHQRRHRRFLKLRVA
jgi:hypothetical protein